MKNTGHAIYQKLVRLWLFSFIVILPFSGRISSFIAQFNTKLSAIIFYLDELIVIIFFLPSIVEHYRNRKDLDNTLLFLLIPPFILFGICGMMSAFINGNSLFITALGIFDYLKNFLVIFIYAAFFNDPNDLRKIYRILIMLALILGTIALIQFFWAMGAVYIFKKDITVRSGGSL